VDRPEVLAVAGVLSAVAGRDEQIPVVIERQIDDVVGDLGLADAHDLADGAGEGVVINVVHGPVFEHVLMVVGAGEVGDAAVGVRRFAGEGVEGPVARGAGHGKVGVEGDRGHAPLAVGRHGVAGLCFGQERRGHQVAAGVDHTDDPAERGDKHPAGPVRDDVRRGDLELAADTARQPRRHDLKPYLLVAQGDVRQVLGRHRRRRGQDDNQTPCGKTRTHIATPYDVQPGRFGGADNGPDAPDTSVTDVVTISMPILLAGKPGNRENRENPGGRGRPTAPAYPACQDRHARPH